MRATKHARTVRPRGSLARTGDCVLGAGMVGQMSIQSHGLVIEP